MHKPILMSLLSVLIPSTVFAWIPESSLTFSTTQSGAFSVPYHNGLPQRNFWCAAGKFVLHDLNMSPNTWIYQLSSSTQNTGVSIRFAASPDEIKINGIARAKNRLRARDAISLCDSLVQLR